MPRRSSHTLRSEGCLARGSCFALEYITCTSWTLRSSSTKSDDEVIECQRRKKCFSDSAVLANCQDHGLAECKVAGKEEEDATCATVYKEGQGVFERFAGKEEGADLDR